MHLLVVTEVVKGRRRNEKTIAVDTNLTMAQREKPINCDDNTHRVKPILPHSASPWP